MKQETISLFDNLDNQIEKTKIVSYSMIALYNQCPFRYKLAIVDKITISKKQQSYLMIGWILHLVLQDFFSLPVDERSTDKIIELLKNRWKWNYEKEKGDSYFDHCESILVNYCKNFDLKTQTTFLETGFKASLNNQILLKGKFDRIDKLENGRYEIIDYKYGNEIAKTLEEVKDDLQWIIYWHGFSKKYHDLLMPEKVSFHFLNASQSISIQPTESDLQNSLQNLTNNIELMNNDTEFEKRRGLDCNNCYFYKKECDLSDTQYESH